MIPRVAVCLVVTMYCVCLGESGVQKVTCVRTCIEHYVCRCVRCI